MSPDPKLDALPEVHAQDCDCHPIDRGDCCMGDEWAPAHSEHPHVDPPCAVLRSDIRRSILEAELRGLEIHDLPYLAARRTKLKEELAALKEPR